jgi:hypothetical protein
VFTGDDCTASISSFPGGSRTRTRVGKLLIKDQARASHAHHPAWGMAYTACGQPFKRPGPRQPRYSYRTMALCFQMDSLSE